MINDKVELFFCRCCVVAHLMFYSRKRGDFMKKDDLIKLLATGIVEWYEDAQIYGDLSKMPIQLKRAINVLCSKMPIPLVINNRIDIVDILSKPLGELEIGEESMAYDNEILIAEGMPTDICYEIAIDEADTQGSIDQSKILDIINELRLYGTEEDYVKIRCFIIEHPIAEEKEIDDFIRKNTEYDIQLRKIYSKVKEFYEEVPYHAKKNNEMKVCKCCGWTITQKDEDTYCISNFCKIQEGHKHAKQRIVDVGTKRLKRGAMRYLCLPGIPELELKRKLERKGVGVRMWPHFDLFDLEVIFNDEKWAVDVKDYSNPYHLIEKVTTFPVTDCSQNFVVVPKRRMKLYSAYKKVIKAEQTKGFQFIGEDELMKKISEKVRK